MFRAAFDCAEVLASWVFGVRETLASLAAESPGIAPASVSAM